MRIQSGQLLALGYGKYVRSDEVEDAEAHVADHRNVVAHMQMFAEDDRRPPPRPASRGGGRSPPG
jgi:hypothetical protein